MSKAADYARSIRQFHNTLLRRYGKPRIPPARDATDELIYALLARHAPEQKAASGLATLRRGSVDLNDLRVTPVSALAELLGDGFPNAHEAAATVSRVLNGLFTRRYTLDLTFLRTSSRRDAERLLGSLPGIDPHDVALFLLRLLDAHCVPIDPAGLAVLRHMKLVNPAWSHAETQTFLQRVIPHSQAHAFYSLLKRQAAAKPAPPPPRQAAPPPPPVPVPAPPVSPNAKKPVRPAPPSAKRPAAPSHPPAKTRSPVASSAGQRKPAKPKRARTSPRR